MVEIYDDDEDEVHVVGKEVECEEVDPNYVARKISSLQLTLKEREYNV
jgi:hypothetical protein